MEFKNRSAYMSPSCLVEGMTSLSQFEESERYLEEIATFRSKGLTDSEILLYYQNKNGSIQSRHIEQSALDEKLKVIRNKIENVAREKSPVDSLPIKQNEVNKSSTDQTSVFYPDGHPMNSITELEDDLFGHLDVHKIAPISKRRKLLRRLTRKEERCNKSLLEPSISSVKVKSKSSFNKVSDLNKQNKSKWDIQEACDSNSYTVKLKNDSNKSKIMIGPKPETLYTIKDNKIVRVESLGEKKYRAAELKVPINKAEERLLEGTKLSVDDIRKMPKFHDYHPGTPSKVLFIKNISSAVTKADLEEKFEVFTQDVRLMSGRMKGQAFVHMREIATATCALEQINGTIMKGKPIIITYGKSARE